MSAIQSALQRVLPGLDERQRSAFWRYYEMLVDWNERMNLTAITEPSEVAAKHFADSLLPEKMIPFGSDCIDIGTGAGFPGIPLKIARPDIRMTLLDSLSKRITFLKAVTDELGLEAVLIHARAEDGARRPELRERFDAAVSRAVASAGVIAELTLPYLRVGGISILYKGPMVHEELKSSDRAFKLLFADADVFNKKTDWGERNIVVLTKQKQTPPIYPRKAGTPSKSPL